MDGFLFNGQNSCDNLTEYNSYYADLLKVLIYQHGHADAKKRCAVVQKRLTDGLDFDEAGKVIKEAAEELPFIESEANRVWYKQNEAMLRYVRDETEMKLTFLSQKFSHLTPPELRNKYNL